MRLSKLVLAGFLVILSGCAQNCGAFEDIEGSPFYSKPFESLIEGKTTKREVIKAMGEPALALTWNDGSEIIKYRWVRERVSTKETFGLVTDTSVERAQENLFFQFKDGFLVSKKEEFFTYSLP